MARKKTVSPQAVKPEQATQELSKLDQELFPEGYPENPLVKPIEAVEEESTESKADTPETDDIAVIEAQDVVQGTTKGTEGIPDEALIDLTPVGAEVVEKALAENPELSKEFIEDALKATQEVLEGKVSSYENPEDNYTESDEDGDGVPEHYVFDWANQPVAATLIHIRETKINSLVEKVIFASYLGGELYKSGVQLNRVPYRANVLIPTSKVQQFLSGEGKLEYEEGYPYTACTVKGISAHLFLKRIIAVSKKGAVITPLKKAVNNNGFLVSLQCKAPVAQSPSFQLAAHKPKYSVDELKELSAESLRIVCSWYNIPYKGKVQSRIDIKMKQDEQK
jgi:hypothetical protein